MEDYIKRCCRCKMEKSSVDFNKSKQNKDGLHNHCRLCQKECRKKWYNDNRTKELSKATAYSKTEKARKKQKEYYTKNKELVHLKNRIRRSKEPALIKQRENEKKRRLENPQYRIGQNLRSRVRCAVLRQFTVKKDSSNELLGCTNKFVIEYLASKFKEGMSWDNYGINGWHIDHIIPCDFFDLSILEEQKKCFHYTNLQPLWWWENISKGNKIL